MKADLIADCARLAGQLESLSASQGQLGQKAQASLRQLVTASQALLHLMRQVSENYVDLTAVGMSTDHASDARSYWQSLPAGRLEQSQIEELVQRRSAVLRKLYRASIDFTAITKFSDAELSFAREIGDNFRVHRRFWARLKKILADGRPFRIVHDREVRGAVAFFQLLGRYGLVSRVEVRLQRGEEVRTFDLASVAGELRKSPLSTADRLHIHYEFDRKQQTLLTGGWFEAYSSHVFENMLTRLAADFEIYSRVQYEANVAARASSRGDIDVLVSLRDQIVMVECKSADLSADEATRVIQKTRFLREIFSSMGIKETTFMLVCVPGDTDESEAILGRVEAEGIDVVEPQDIRSFLRTKLTPEDMQ